MHFGESHYATIRKIHRRIGVSPKKFPNRLQLVAQGYRFQAYRVHEIEDTGAGYSFLCSKMTDLGENRLADKRSRSHLEESSTRPRVMLVSRAEPRDDRTGV